MWRRNKLRPEHHTSANVRRDHLNPRRDVCRTLTLGCQQRDRCGGAWVAIAGRPVSAVNAKGRHVTTATLEPVIAPIDGPVADDLTALEAADAQDEAGTPGGARAAELPTQIEALRGRRRRYEALQAEWERRGHDQRSVTDPDRRARKGGNGGGTAVCDHGQTAVEAKHQRIVAGDVAHEPTDRDWLSPVALAAKAVLGGACDAVAEVGDDQGHEVTPGLHAGMTPSIARPITAATQPLGLCSTDDVTSEAATDTSGCPAGEGLSCRVDPVALGRHMRS
jgi:hypothetical protein